MAKKTLHPPRLTQLFPKSAKNHPTLIKNDLTFAKKALKSAKKCKKMQKTSFHPKKPPFFTTPKTKNPIFSQIQGAPPTLSFVVSAK